MERIRKLMPQAGTFEGAEKAKGELRQLMNKFERDSQALQKRLSEPLSPKAREEVNNRLNGLYMSRQTVYEALQRLQPKGVVLSDEDNALIDKYLEAN
jgi:DNA-binding PadR family transcriptional regulator